MRYFVKSDTYSIREEENGIFSVFVKATNQLVFFNRSAKIIFRDTDKWHDLTDVIQGMHLVRTPFERVFSDFFKLLTRIWAAGIAELSDIPPSSFTGVRMLGATDCFAIGRFCQDNLDNELTWTRAINKEYYSDRGFFGRLDQATQQVAVLENEGRVTAALMASRSERDFGGISIAIDGIVADASLTEKQLAESLVILSDFMNEDLKKRNLKLRFEYFNANQDKMASIVAQAGFVQTLMIKNELKNGGNLILLDKK